MFAGKANAGKYILSACPVPAAATAKSIIKNVINAVEGLPLVPKAGPWISSPQPEDQSGTGSLGPLLVLGCNL